MPDTSTVDPRHAALEDFRRGVELLDDQPDRAIEHLWAGHRQDAERRWFAERLARALWLQGSGDDAARVVATYADPTARDLPPFEEAVLRRAEREAAQARRAILATLTDDRSSAYRLATSALDRFGERGDLHLLAARACPDPAGKLEHLRAAHVDPADAATGRQLAVELWTQGQRAEAAAVVGGYTEGGDVTPSPFERRALDRLDLERRRRAELDEARRRTARREYVAALAPADRRIRRRTQERVDDTLDNLWAEHRADPTHAATASRLARLLTTLGRPDEADAVLAAAGSDLTADAMTARRARRLADHEENPTDVEAGRRLASDYYLTGEMDRARAVITRYVASLSPDQDLEDFEVRAMPELAAGLVETVATAHRRLQERGTDWRAAHAIVIRFLRGTTPATIVERIDMLAALPLPEVAAEVLELERQAMVRDRALMAECSPNLRARIKAEFNESAGPPSQAVTEFADDSAETVLSFVGLRSRPAGLNSGLHRVIRAGGRNAVYVSDPMNLYHMAGLPGVENGIDGAVDHLRERIHRLGTRRLVVLGASSGSYAAIRYGLRLDAHGILAFGPVTRIDGDMQLLDGRAALIWQRFAKELPDGFGSLRAEIAARPEIPVHLFYGSEYVPDVLQAEHVGDLPNVHHHVIEGFAHHQVPTPLRASGRFAAALDAAFAAAG